MPAKKSSLLESIAKSKTQARAEARRLEISVLEKLIATLNDVLAAEKAKVKGKQEAERQDQIKKINALLAKSGLKPDDLKKVAAVKARKTGVRRGPKKGAGTVAPKYRLVVGGVEHQWTGRGRTPKVFADHFAAGNSRDSVSI